MTYSNDSMTRRGLLGQALGAAALPSALNSASQVVAQTPEAPARFRDSFDFGWKFFKGDAPGAQQPGFADAAWRGLGLTCRTIGASKDPSSQPSRRWRRWLRPDRHRLVP